MEHQRVVTYRVVTSQRHPYHNDRSTVVLMSSWHCIQVDHDSTAQHSLDLHQTHVTSCPHSYQHRLHYKSQGNLNSVGYYSGYLGETTQG